MSPPDSQDSLTTEVDTAHSGERLDRFLPTFCQGQGRDLSRSALQALVKGGHILVNGNRVKPRHAIALGDIITIAFPAERSAEPQPEEIPLTVLHEDEDIIVVDKVHGIVVHPGSGNDSGTLVNALLHQCEGKLCELAGADRPGIVHRLDKDTSGCLVAAKSELAYHSLVGQFSGRETGKRYLAVTRGVPANPAGTIRNQIGRHPVNRQRMAVLEAPAGKEAITDYAIECADEKGKWAALSCVIHTGRTHQIRVHLKETLQYPILGDPIYGSAAREKVKVARLLLHARELCFRHPATGRTMTFRAEIPEAFSPFLSGARSDL